MIDNLAKATIEPEEVSRSTQELKEKLDYQVKISSNTLQSIKRVAPKSEELINTMIKDLIKYAEEEKKQTINVLNKLAKTQNIGIIPEYEPEEKPEPAGSNKTPEKLYRGPLSSRPWIAKLSKEDRKAYKALNKKHGIEYGGPATLALYWTDGNRTVSEISKLVKLESGSTNLEYLIEYFGFLEKLQLIKLHNR